MTKKEKRKQTSKRIVAFLLAVTNFFAITGCSSEKDDTQNESASIIYEAGEHEIIDVQRKFKIGFGKKGRYGLLAPKGYKIIDYDYDRHEDLSLNFDDYVYVNNEQIKTTNPNEIGVPTSTESKEESLIYEPGTHVIADINRKYNPFFGKDDTIVLTAPEGYEVLDYDYDKTESFAFETITYVNADFVTVKNVDDFGNVVNKKEKENKDYYDIGESKIVVVDRSFNMLFGKRGTKTLTAPIGYKIIDYDYDKTESFEFETITYENVTPVTIKDNDFGTPIDPNYKKIQDGNYYGEGEHVVAKVDRDISLGFGNHGTKEVPKVDGYKLLDYDYEKNEKNMDFETYVYVNEEPVKANYEDDFGTPTNKR